MNRNRRILFLIALLGVGASCDRATSTKPKDESSTQSGGAVLQRGVTRESEPPQRGTMGSPAANDFSTTDEQFRNSRDEVSNSSAQSDGANKAYVNQRVIESRLAAVSGNARIRMAAALIEEWASHEPETAADWLAGNATLRDSGACARALSKAWARRDIRAAADWAFGRSPGQARAAALQQIGRAWGETDVDMAKSVTADVDSDSERERFALSVAEGWAQHDPRSALDWYISLPIVGAEAQREGSYILFSDLASVDFVAAERCMEKLPSGPSRDAAIVGFVETLMNQEPERAIPWIRKVEDPEERADLLQFARDSIPTAKTGLLTLLESETGQ